MNNTVFVTIQSLLLIFILHFLIKNNLYNDDLDEDREIFTDIEIEEEDKIKKQKKREEENKDKEEENKKRKKFEEDKEEELNVNINQIPNKNDMNNTIETFNTDSLKQDLENYLSNKNSTELNYENESKSNADFTNQKTNLNEFYKSNLKNDTKELNKQNESEGDKPNVKKDNKIKYEEWVYKDESIMNGKEFYNGIHAFDDMEDNFANFSM